MAGLLWDAGEHGWRRADAVKYTILASPQRSAKISYGAFVFVTAAFQACWFGEAV